MADKFNKGFKGIDRRDGARYQDENLASKGKQHVQDRFYSRGKHRNQSFDVNTTYQILDWKRMGWSSSFHPVSGAVHYWSPDDAYGNSQLWANRPMLSVPSIRAYNWDGPHLTSSVSFQRGNNVIGNAWYSAHGMFGLVPRNFLHTMERDGTYSAGGSPCTYPEVARAWDYYGTTDQVGVNEYFTSRGKQSSTASGDTFKIQFTKDGVVTYWYAKTGTHGPAATMSLFATSPTNMADDPYTNCWDYNVWIANGHIGSTTYYHSYNWTFQGEVDQNPYYFDKQMEAEFVDMPPELWYSASVLPKAMIGYEDEFYGSSAYQLPSNAAAGAYTDCVMHQYWITGSGDGGAFRMRAADGESWFPDQLIMGTMNKSQWTAFNHATNTNNNMPDTFAWDASEGMTNTEWYFNAWYAGGGTNKVPLYGASTSGSEFMLICTGSNYGFLSRSGSGTTPAINPDNGQIVISLFRQIQADGTAINDWVSPHWWLSSCGIFKGSGGGACREPQKFSLQYGLQGIHICNLQVTSNYIISGTV